MTIIIMMFEFLFLIFRLIFLMCHFVYPLTRLELFANTAKYSLISEQQILTIFPSLSHLEIGATNAKNLIQIHLGVVDPLKRRCRDTVFGGVSGC